ncbi:glycerophosphodiester phosphodiesterase [Halostella litorea]|uniref:glycerophosphodiester phosphodiesterase n=1 Tax=Halostella litorea TaxID=2528831 RepID=UPI0010931C29|nr:glycerophosphodiester phosphodiesterase family protein [Halostella litorea]
MDLIAHRGFAAEAPENTVAAVERAGALADAVEVDVRRCGSGELVVVHDATVDRVTDTSGRIDEFPLAELRALDVLGSGEGIPSLSAVLDAVPAGTTVNLELKEAGLAADALAAADDAGVDVLVSAFEPAALRDVRDVAPDVPTAYLCTHRDDAPVATARRLGCDALHPSVPLCLTTRTVGRARDAGLAVNAWTVNRAVVVRMLSVPGVDGVIADASDVCAPRAGT